MRILIASGIFEPDGGGPATYAPRLAAHLVEAEHEVEVVTFSDKAQFDGDEKYPFSLRRVLRGGRIAGRIRFLRALTRAARNADLIYSLDWYGVGILVTIATWRRRIPYIVRVGGDYVWEQRYLGTHTPMSLATFYEGGAYRSYRIPFYLIRFVLSRAALVVFNTDRERDLYERYFAVERSSVIYNPIPKGSVAGIKRVDATKEIVFWGRFTAMKNIESLVRAFAKARLPEAYQLVLIGGGPRFEPVRDLVSQLGIEPRVEMIRDTRFGSIMERVKNARAFVLPSWTDISPTQVYEALAIGLPALVTKENYLPIHDQLPEMLDPQSVDDIAAKLEMLADDPRYGAFASRFRAISFDWSWEDATKAHLELFERIAGPMRELRVLAVGADRSRRGILVPDSVAHARQKAYAANFDALDIVGFSLARDGFSGHQDGNLATYPTNSSSRFFFGLDAMGVAMKLPRPSVVSAQDPFETGLISWLIARRRKAPLHVQVHTDFLSPAYSSHSLLNRVRVQVAGFVLKRAARVRVVSERIKKEIERTYGLHIPITVLPIYVDIEKFRHPAPDPVFAERFSRFEQTLLVVARLEPEKDVELAIRSFAKAAPEDSCLIIVGQGSEYARLKTITRVLRIDDRVFFEGETAGAKYYPIADLVLVTSRYEGYGLVTVEALASGKPVLSTDVGIAREAGAIVANERDFESELRKWFESGPREGALRNYPYETFDEYVRAYSEDIRAVLS